MTGGVHPKFSIITVTLNPGRNDLAKTVNSVFAQDCVDWELIVKDGGSTDGSLSVLPGDSRIKVFHEKDTGIFDAMNQAILLASGELICLLNAGDYFFDSRVLSAVSETHAEAPSAEFLYGDVHKPRSRSGYEFYPSKLSRYFLFSNMICHQAWFVLRAYYLSAGGYETDCRFVADYRYFLRMHLRDKVNYKHVPRPLIVYKGGGVSQDPKHLAESAEWINSAQRAYFTRNEILLFATIRDIRNLFKKILYDYFLFKMWVVFRNKRIARLIK